MVGPSLKGRDVPPPVRRHRLFATIRSHAALIFVSALFFLPLVFVILTSLMTDQQANTKQLWPSPFVPGNYADVFSAVPFLRYTFNTMTVAFMSTIGVVLSSIPVAYALSRMRWRGRQVVFVLVLATLMLPYQVTALPLYVVFVKVFHWVPGLKPLIVPSFFGDAFSIFLLRQFFRSIPDELADAARVDGANDWQIMTRVIVPLAKPAIAAVALFNFLYAWNDFFAPLLYVGEDNKSWTLAIGLSEFKALHHVQWNLTMAASLEFMIPVVILFFLMQRVFIEGITVTGVKG
ncbi:MAG TPA: carbohydrate ABC transporter permease [Actinomycetota bacterium]|jgi:multiple sugar transport system permease protein|nr:carbohydrate ABC transporter permease [Actinomycetota bacterium]